MDLKLGFFGFGYMCMCCIVRHRFASALAMMRHCLFEGRRACVFCTIYFNALPCPGYCFLCVR